MSNEELAALIQAGERGRLPELWVQVERFVAKQANRCLAYTDGVEFADLYNSGYIALVDAVSTYDPGKGAFTTWLALHLKTAFAEAGGYRSRKQALDPLHNAMSIYAPINDEDGTIIGDIIEDTCAAQDFQNAEDKIWNEELHSALEKALDTLPDAQSDTLRRKYYRGQTLDEIAAEKGVYKETVRQWQNKAFRGMRKPNVSRSLRQFIEIRTPYYAHVNFRQTGERTVEMIVLKRETLAEGPKSGNPEVEKYRRTEYNNCPRTEG